MDFVHNALADGRPFRILTVVDQWSRQIPMLEVALNMSGQTVGEALDRVLAGGTVPRSITVDHGTEFQRLLSYEFVILEEYGTACEFALDDIYWQGGTIVAAEDAGVGPGVATLLANTPNPFKASTQLRFVLPAAGPYEIVVYTSTGSG